MSLKWHASLLRIILTNCTNLICKFQEKCFARNTGLHLGQDSHRLFPPITCMYTHRDWRGIDLLAVIILITYYSTLLNVKLRFYLNTFTVTDFVFARCEDVLSQKDVTRLVSTARLFEYIYVLCVHTCVYICFILHRQHKRLNMIM